MIAVGIFSESMTLDLGVIGTIITGFATIIGMLWQMKKNRGDEIKAAVSEIINASPEKIVVSPQPLLVKMEERFVKVDDLKDLERRVMVLEGHRESDKKELLDRIDGIPARVIATLKDVWGMRP